MVDIHKEPVQEKTGAETVSILDEKRHSLLEGLSELMDQTSEGYSPLLMEEFQRRLEFVVQNFNEEVKALINKSFEEWKNRDSKIRDLMAEDRKIPGIPIEKERSAHSSAPDFIKDVEFGPVRPK